MMAIYFYTSGRPYGYFSNFSPYPVEIDGQSWPTTEHYFQAMKFPHDPERQQKIRQTPKPGQAKRLAYARNAQARQDWDTYRNEVMLKAVRAKFQQYAKLRELLLATGEELLAEHTCRDCYWGDGGDGGGENMLGKILMQVRTELRSQK